MRASPACIEDPMGETEKSPVGSRRPTPREPLVSRACAHTHMSASQFAVLSNFLDIHSQPIFQVVIRLII